MSTMVVPGIATEQRLIGWKAIGSFLGCDARTAKRWEAARAMPVHRMPGDGIPTVWADRAQLRAWLAAPATGIDAVPTTIADEPVELHSMEPVDAVSLGSAPVERPQPLLHRRWIATLALAGLVIVGSATVLLSRVPPRLEASQVTISHGPYDDDGAARATYLNARFELATRSGPGIEAARRDFQSLTMRFPDRAAGYSGLADAYVLSREFGAVPDTVAFPRAAQAARTALALDPDLPDAWLNRAYVAFWWEHDLTSGLAAFRQAIERAPNSAKAHHWFATASLAAGDDRVARSEIERARALDSDNHAIVADAAFIELSAGNYAAAVPALEALTQVDPRLVSGHRYLAAAYLITGRDADYLREAAATATLLGRPNQVAGVARAAAAWQRGGRTTMLDQLSLEAIAAAARGEGCLNDVISLRALAGDRAGVLHWLAIARQRHVRDVVFLLYDPVMIAWRHDPALIAAARSS